MVPVTITDNMNRPVIGLDEDNFQLFEKVCPRLCGRHLRQLLQYRRGEPWPGTAARDRRPYWGEGVFAQPRGITSYHASHRQAAAPPVHTGVSAAGQGTRRKVAQDQREIAASEEAPRFSSCHCAHRLLCCRGAGRELTPQAMMGYSSR